MVNIFCIEKVNVASNALTRPIKSKDISVAVAIITPPTTGINEQYTCRVREKINESNQYYFTMQKIEGWNAQWMIINPHLLTSGDCDSPKINLERITVKTGIVAC